LHRRSEEGKILDYQEQSSIDIFDTEEEAQAMLVEYQLAFGHDFTLWVEDLTL
jgi:hypothetical protein